MTSQPSNQHIPSAASTAPVARWAGSDDYVEFFLANMWTWTPSGMRRVLDFFNELNSAGSTFTFESSLILRVRCMKKERDYIQRNFLKLQGIIEDEITDLQTGLDGALSWGGGHADIELPEAISTITNGSRLEGLHIHHADTPDQVMSLEVPDELRDCSAVVAWQDLQPKDQVFEIVFISGPAKRAVEQAHGVKMMFDFGQKVVFIGAPSIDAANVVKIKLTILLQDYLSSQMTSTTARHIFLVQTTQPFDVDVRNIEEVNTTMARSTILDPWELEPAKGYEQLLDDIFCLRICREEPYRGGHRNKKWSIFGPCARGVLGVAEPKSESQLFKSISVPKRSALSLRGDEGVNVNEWRKHVAPGVETMLKAGFSNTFSHPLPNKIRSELEPSSGIDQSALIHLDENAPIFIYENDPVCLASEHAASRRSWLETPVYGTESSILDQNDPVLQDPKSTLQRAMLPAKRTIVVQHPDSLPAIALPEQHAEVDQRGELGKLCASLKYMMRPMRRRWGVVSLRAEIGRYYAYDVAPSGRACNSLNEPANGWEPEDLRPQLESDQPFFFTKALTSLGSDIEFFRTLKIAGTQQRKWEPKFGTTFLDFHFQAPKTNSHGQEDDVSNIVLEVNAQDYTWAFRDLDSSTNGLVYCHCLDHHWDFRVRLSHEHPLEHEERWGRFAQALVSSLEVEPPKFRFQHSFHEALIADCPITIRDVRIRQVYRIQHHNQGTFLDITRVMPTEAEEHNGVRTGWIRNRLWDDPEIGAFSHWFEVSISSARLEKLLEQNERLIPGDEADWTIEQLQREGLLAELADEAFAIVGKIDGVGVLCDNGHEKRKSAKDNIKYPW